MMMMRGEISMEDKIFNWFFKWGWIIILLLLVFFWGCIIWFIFKILQHIGVI